MGLSLLLTKRGNGAPSASEEALQERFGAHFPRLFAYVRSWVGDDAARDAVVEAFSAAFARCPDSSDQKFRLVLFRLARDLCRSATRGKKRPHDALSPREREVLSLFFDAQISRSEIGHLLNLKEATITATLMRGLKKLQESTTPATVAAYLRLT